MNERASAPARTFALLVGVERYAGGNTWSLNGPLRDVIAFRDWLLSKDVPPANILAVTSPIAENESLRKDAGLGESAATSEGVRAAFNRLHDQRGDLLFVFWAGHGFIPRSDERRCLLLADATGDDRRNLDLDQLLQSLRSTYFQGFPRQIVIVDACADYVQSPYSLPSEPLRKGDPLGQEQFVFFAAQPGHVTKNLGEEKRGLFSREFLKQASAADSTWPPDMKGLAERVQNEFASLRASKKFSQTPVFSWNRNWDGSTIALKSGPADGANRTRPDAVSVVQLRALTEALMQCAGMSRQSERDDVLIQLRTDISGSIPRRSDTRSDVFNIVQTTSKYPGGLEELLESVAWYNIGTTAWQDLERVVAQHFPNLTLRSAAVDRTQ